MKRPVELNDYEQSLAGRSPDHEENDMPIELTEAWSLRRYLISALRHGDSRLSRLAMDAISRARSCQGLFEANDMPRLKKAAEAGDTANRLYAAALLLALSGLLFLPDDTPVAA